MSLYTVFDISDADIRFRPSDTLPDELQPRTLIANAVEMDWELAGQVETVLIFFVAVVGFNNDFKVYFNLGDRFSPEQIVTGHSPKVQNEGFARAVFPMLNTLTFKIQ